MAEGLLKIQELQKAGFSNEEVATWQQDTAEELRNAGFSMQEVDSYFGKKEPNMKSVEDLFTLQRSPIEEANSILSAIDAGWQMSVSGLLARGKAPEVVLPENASMAQSIAAQSTTIVADLPAMVAGAIGGEAALPAGGPISAGAGAFAVPTAMRETLMEVYNDESIQSFEEFWSKASNIFINTAKSAALGAATVGAGKFVKGKLPATTKPAARTSAQLATEVGTLTTVGAALEGEVPEPSHFLEAAIMVTGLRIAGLAVEPTVRVGTQISTEAKKVAVKLRDIYAKTGVKPEEVLRDVDINPYLQAELLSKNVAIPSFYEAKTQPAVMAKAPELASPNFPKNLLSSDVVDILANQRGELKIPPMPEIPREVPTIKRPTKEPELLGPKKPETPTEHVLSRITQDKKLKESTTFDEIYTNAIDDLHPIRVLRDAVQGKDPISPIEDPFIMARLTRGNFGRADQMLNNATFDFKTLANNGKGLKQVLEPIQGQIENFTAFAVSKRVIELEGKGIKTGVELEKATAVVKQFKQFEPVAKELVDYQNRTLKYMIDSGLISKEVGAKMMEGHKSYIPFYRLLKESKADFVEREVKQVVKRIKGSEKEIINPLESVIKNTHAYIAMAEKNRVTNNIVEMAKNKGAIGEEFVKKVPTKTRPIEVSKQELQKVFEDMGITADAETFSIFRPQSAGLKANEIVRFKDGKREVYEVAPSVAKAVNALDTPTAGLLSKVFTLPAKTLRAGTTISPDFPIRNVIRDQFQTFIVTKTGEFVPVYDAAKGARAIFGKGEKDYQAWLKGGGANSVMQSMDRNYIQRDVFKLAKETGFMNSAVNVVKSPIEMLSIGSELMENATRVGVFKRITKGEVDPNAIVKGAFESRDLLDFARTGAKMRGLDNLVAFHRSHVQGMDKLARAVKERPLETTTKAIASITVPSILLWWANKDDPRYQDLPDWQKDLFWVVPTKDTIYRIPKPFEPGIVFGSGVERSLDAFYKKDPKAFKDFSATMTKAFIPPFMPNAATPIIEHYANKSTFTGSPIIPHRLERVMPKWQYSEYTSESAKILGKVVGKGFGDETSLRSPAVLENYIRAWSGSMGMYALQTADAILTKSGVVPEPLRPAKTLADIPFIKAFVIREPSAGTQPIIDFYEKYDIFSKRRNSIKMLAKEGDFDNLQKEMSLKENQAALIKLDGIAQGMNTQRKMIRKINKVPDMTPEEKRAQIDHIYRLMNEFAKAGNSLVESIEKAVESGEGE